MDEEMEIDREEEYPKGETNRKSVKFKTKNENTESLFVDEKCSTILKTCLLDTIVIEEQKIRDLKTMEEIADYSDLLFKGIEDCERMKKQGHDKTAIREEYESIKKRFEWLNEVKQNLENHKVKKNIPRRDTIETPLYATAAAKSKHESLNLEIYNYLKELNSNCDLVFMFHCCTIKPDVEHYVYKMMDIFKENTNLKICIFDTIEKNTFRFSRSLLDHANYKSLSFETITKESLEDLQNNFINLKWSKRSLRVLCNVVNLKCKHNAKNIKAFLEKGPDDTLKNLMDYNKIHRFTFFVDNHLDEKYKSFDTDCISDVEQVFANQNILKAIEVASQYSLMEHVYSLKRSHFSSFDEFLKLKASNTEDKLEMNFKAISFVTNNTISMSTVLSDEGILLKDLQNRSGTTSMIKVLDHKNPVSKLYSIYSAKVNDTISVWLEVFKHQQTALNVLDIHLTTRFFVTKFNERMKTDCICIPKASIFNLLSKPDFAYAQYVDYGLDKASANMQIRSNELLQAFMHFTFQESNETMVIFDLRAIELNKKMLLLTEPIIFSTFANRFGMSNLGTEALNYLISSHECNSYCDKFLKNGSSSKVAASSSEKQKFCFLL